jgi:hypothetical protein
MTSIEALTERVTRLEAQQGLATKADIANARVDISRDIADLANGVGNDLRAIRQDITGLRGDIREVRQELTGIRELLERHTFRWPWERRP